MCHPERSYLESRVRLTGPLALRGSSITVIFGDSSKANGPVSLARVIHNGHIWRLEQG